MHLQKKDAEMSDVFTKKIQVKTMQTAIEYVESCFKSYSQNNLVLKCIDKRNKNESNAMQCNKI